MSTGDANLDERRTSSYTFCPTCGEPIETADLDAHAHGCDGSIPGRVRLFQGEVHGIPAALDVEFHETIYDRAERRSDAVLQDDGSGR
jgi:hypothetical protein